MPTCLVGPTLPSKPSVFLVAWQGRNRHLLLVALMACCVLPAQASTQEAGGGFSARVASEAISSQETVKPTTVQTPAPDVGKNGKVCRSEDVTGSRMKKRVCYTPEQWEARERASKEMVRELDGKSIPKDANGG